MRLRIGTRGSRLALWQAQFVADRLCALGVDAELVEIQTAGDQILDLPLAQLGGQGVFTKEIQRALLEQRVDVAVHSLKDLPTVAIDGLALAAVPPRGPTGDVLVAVRYDRLDDLPDGATVATGSLRRQAQLLQRRPDLCIVDIRGNIETRLRKLREQSFDALILAEAGLERLGLAAAIKEVLDPAWMLPAVGQGALGLECRTDDAATLAIVSRLNDAASYATVCAERSLLRQLGGGCQAPIGASASVANDLLRLHGVVLSPDGRRRVVGSHDGSRNDAELVGRQLAQQLCALGAAEVLAEVQKVKNSSAPS